jgi:hypothetical protein
MGQSALTSQRWCGIGTAAIMVAIFLQQLPAFCAEDQEARNLLDVIDLSRDTIQGTWSLEGNTLASPSSGPWAVLSIPHP